MYGADRGAEASMYGADAQRQVGLDRNRVQENIGNQNYNLGMGNLNLGQQGLDQQGFFSQADLDLRTQLANEGTRQFDMNFLSGLIPGTGDPNNPNYGGQILNPYDQLLDYWPQGG